MGYNFSAHVIVEKPDMTYYSSGVSIVRERFVWIHGLEKFLPIKDVFMYVNCILVKDDDQFFIFNNFAEFLAKSMTKVDVNDDGYIILRDSRNYILESVDGKNLYEEPFWHLLPYMGGRIGVPYSLLKEKRFVRTKSGKDIAELTGGLHVEIYEQGVLIKYPCGKYSYMSTKFANGEVIISDAYSIMVYADSLCVRETQNGSFHFIKDP